MKVLIFATGSSELVVRAAARIVREVADAAVTVGVPEVEEWKYAGTGLATLVLGEKWLTLDSRAVRAKITAQGFDLTVIPMGLPRQTYFYVIRFMRSHRERSFRLIFAGLELRRPALIVLFLFFYSIFCFGPISVFLRSARWLDGGLLLATHFAARVFARPRSPARSSDLVCHTVTSLGTGGAQRQVVEYLRNTTPDGSALRLLVLFEYNDTFVKELDDLGVEYEVIYRRCRSSRLGRFCGRSFPNATVVLLLWLRLRQLRPRCTYSWLFLANVITAPAARLAGVGRVISSVRNLSAWKEWPAYRHWWYRPADRLSAPLNDVIVGNAEAVARDYVAWSGHSPARTAVIRNAIDVDHFLALPTRDVRSELGIGGDEVIALTIGRLAYEKNHALMLRSFADARSWGCTARLIIVGHGELEQELRSLAESLGLGLWVHFAGKTTEPESFYRAADLFLLSSDIEGLPNVLLEAQAFGLAAVTTRGGGSAEVVEDRVTGFVVDVGDRRTFAKKIEHLAGDEDLRRRMGRAAEQRMRSHFSMARMAAAIDRLTGRSTESR